QNLRLLRDLLVGYEPRDFAVRFWDGSQWDAPSGTAPRFTIVAEHPGSIRALLWPPHLITAWEAYIYGDIDIQGDLLAFMRLASFLGRARRSHEALQRIAARVEQLSNGLAPRGLHRARLSGEPHSIERDRAAIAHHYDDVPTPFYALWLGRQMVYTCGYFLQKTDDLDVAQHQKMDHVCRKLRLTPGDRLLDVGCGWGGLIMHASREYEVDAVGVTNSPTQFEWTAERIQEGTFDGRCRVLYTDYRDVDEPGGYDAISILEVLEHLGEAMVPAFFDKAWTLLRPGGRLLVQTITTSLTVPPPPSWSMVAAYVFPDAEPLSLVTSIRAAEEVGFEVRDIESLREHYALTLDHWLRRLDARRDEARALTDDIVYRIWRVYLAGSRHGFDTGAYNLYQYLLVKPDEGQSGTPLTRRDWYNAG
ncbi:MAG TPA: cyclopropane-fatty-acyl-phospholipid synthase family protein, partial [Vicinamibacterales bacterium]